MKSLKKSLIFLVVLTMVLSTVAPVFAATPSDVIGTAYEEAVTKLVDLGVISGYEDGTFKPEANITRAEFAKIACYVVGVKDAADLSKGPTKFSDVPATHWASGYINVAAEKGLLKGYSDGKFLPEANVTYAEAITILVRALGYAQVVEGKGTWPANYLAKAASIGVTDGVSGLSTTAAGIRGVIAQLTWNTLTAETWGEKEYNADGIVYGPTGKTLIKDYYNDYSYWNATDDKYETKEFTDVRVIANQSNGNLAADELQLDASTNEDLANLLDDGDYPVVEVNDNVKASVSLGFLFGKKVDILFGKDNKVAYIKASTDNNVVEGFVKAEDYDDNKVTVNGKEYSFKSDAIVYMGSRFDAEVEEDGEPVYDNFTEAFNTMKAVIGDSTSYVSAVLENGKIAYMSVITLDSLTDYDAQPTTKYQFVVKEIDDGDVIDMNDDVVFNIDDVTSDENALGITLNIKPATADDIKVGNVITYAANGTNTFITMSDLKVTGKITKVGSVPPGNSRFGYPTRKALTIDGKTYQMAHDLVMMTTTGDNDDAKVIDSDISDFYGETATLYLNAGGEIVYVSADVGEATANSEYTVGVVTRNMYASGADYGLKVLTEEGTTTTYTVTGDKFTKYDLDTATVDPETSVTDLDYDEESDYTVDLDVAAVTEGDLVLFKASADKVIDGEDLFVINGCTVDDQDTQIIKIDPSADIDAVKDSAKKITVDSHSYYAKSGTTFLNDQNIEKIDGWDALVSDDAATQAAVAEDDVALRTTAFGSADTGYIVLDGEDSNNIRTLIIDISSDDYMDTTASYGIYAGAYSQGNDDFVTLNIKGTNEDYVVGSGSVSGLAPGDLVRFNLNGDGEYRADTDAKVFDYDTFINPRKEYINAVDEDVYKVKTFEDGQITFKDDGDRLNFAVDNAHDVTDTVSIASDAVVYDVTEKFAPKKASLSDISAGDYVIVSDLNEDDEYEVVVIFK